MNRGMVMEIEGSTAIAMTPDGQFVRVRADGQMQVGLEIGWTAADVVAGRRSRLRPAVRLGACAAALALLVFAAVLWSYPAPVVAYVSMDVNPSIELGLDARERVRELRAISRDAETMIAGIPYRGKPVEQVTETLARKWVLADMLRQDEGEIVIASVGLGAVDRQWELRVADKIRQTLEQAIALAVAAANPSPEPSGASSSAAPAASPGGAAIRMTIETVFLPVEVREEAVEQGLSSGKMAFYLAAESSGHKVDLQELQAGSMREIASSIGGLKQVMEEGAIDKSDQESWRKLLADAKQTDAQLQTNKAGVAANSAASGKDQEKAADKRGQGARTNGKDQADGKQKAQGKEQVGKSRNRGNDGDRNTNACNGNKSGIKNDNRDNAGDGGNRWGNNRRDGNGGSQDGKNGRGNSKDYSKDNGKSNKSSGRDNRKDNGKSNSQSPSKEKNANNNKGGKNTADKDKAAIKSKDGDKQKNQSEQRGRDSGNNGQNRGQSKDRAPGKGW